MSIITVTYVAEGIAMAADSRLTGLRNYEGGKTDRYSLTDNYQKLFLLGKPNVGISFCGDAIIEDKTIGDFIRVFEIENVVEEDSVITIAEKLHNILKERCSKYATSFYVCGYNKDEPYVFVTGSGFLMRKNVNDRGSLIYGYAINGEYEAAEKLIGGANPTAINFPLMPLKDAADFSEFLAEVVIKYQRFEDRVATCGGPVDVLLITKDYTKFIKHKIFNP